jgi:hypothetical protein
MGSMGIGAQVQITVVNHIFLYSMKEQGDFLYFFKKSLTLEFYSFIESYSSVETTQDLR